MKKLLLLLGVFIGGLYAQVSSPGVFIAGSPPGGIGGACSTTTIGYLTAAGQVVTCVSSVWTVSAGSSGGTVTSVVFSAPLTGGTITTTGTVGLSLTTTSCTAPAFVTAINASGVGTCTAPRLPPNSKSANYTTVALDAGKLIVHLASDNNARTFTIDSNANAPITDGCISFYNGVNTLTIAITSDTLVLVGTGSTGSRTLAAFGIATACKIDATDWVISGIGLT